jgi:uncharacterized membrane protein
MTNPAIAKQVSETNANAAVFPASPRIPSIDALRGLVMIIMALDHVRDFFHSGAMSFPPEDLARTTAALFFTRWITHFCAPVFAFAAGVGAFLWFSRGRSLQQLSRFLVTRGLWLVLLDVVVVRFAMFFTFTNVPFILNVLWALGWSMVILAFLARLPVRVLAAFSIAVIVLHNLADPVPAAAFGSAAWVWNVLHAPGAIPVGGAIVFPAYPLVPWFAVMAAGFCFGPILLMGAPRRRTWLLRIGLGLTLAFLLIRWLNIYGDPQPWSHQATPLKTLLSFFRCTKYPPSLDFLLMTLGPAMLVWRWLDGVRLGRSNPLIVFGRVPLFYFIVHLFLIHALTVVLALARYGAAGFLRNPLPSMGGSAELYPPGFGYSLPVVYLLWILVVVLMYVPCAYFSRLKERRRDWWLSYL